MATQFVYHFNKRKPLISEECIMQLYSLRRKIKLLVSSDETSLVSPIINFHVSLAFSKLGICIQFGMFPNNLVFKYLYFLYSSTQVGIPIGRFQNQVESQKAVKVLFIGHCIDQSLRTNTRTNLLCEQNTQRSPNGKTENPNDGNNKDPFRGERQSLIFTFWLKHRNQV